MHSFIIFHLWSAYYLVCSVLAESDSTETNGQEKSFAIYWIEKTESFQTRRRNIAGDLRKYCSDQDRPKPYKSLLLH